MKEQEVIKACKAARKTIDEIIADIEKALKEIRK